MRETKGKSQGAKIRENRTALVAHLVQSVKEGGSLWEPMWNSVAMRPRNPMSGAIYQGRNRLILMDRAIQRGYQDPRWMTFAQAKAKGYFVKKGEHGTICEKFIFSKEEKYINEKGKTQKREILLDRPIPVPFIVFNAEQIQDFPVYEKPQTAREEAERRTEALKTSSDCPIHEVAQEKSFYRPSDDQIYLPLRSSFYSNDAYAHVLAHEMTHSTGAAHRLARTFGSRIYGIPDRNYCIEELRAELGSLFICTDLDLVGNEEKNFEQSSAYTKYYIEILTEDPNILFTAATDAQKAEDFIVNRLDPELIKEIHKVDVIGEKMEEKEQKESLENSSPVLEPKIDEPEESEQNIASDLILQSFAGLNR